jgi:Pyridoxamine 5'-phosphate oxidase
MPEQHRAFWSVLPLFYVGTVDGRGRPWASALAGRPGFVRGVDSHTLHISAKPAFAGDHCLHCPQSGKRRLLYISAARRHRACTCQWTPQHRCGTALR